MRLCSETFGVDQNFGRHKTGRADAKQKWKRDEARKGKKSETTHTGYKKSIIAHKSTKDRFQEISGDRVHPPFPIPRRDRCEDW